MKKHKIRNVDINICCCEQKIAYNYLFSHSNYSYLKDKFLKPCFDYYTERAKNLDFIKRDLLRNEAIKNKYDIDLIFHIILYNYNDYVFSNNHILSTYNEIGKNLKIGYNC